MRRRTPRLILIEARRRHLENRRKAAKPKYIVRKQPAATGREARCGVGAPSSNRKYEDSIRGISFLLFLTIDSRFTAPPFV